MTDEALSVSAYGEAVEPRPFGLRHIVARLQRATHRQAQIVDEHEVVLHAAILVSEDPVEHLDDRPDTHHQAGLLEQFPRDPILEGLPHFQRAARNAPPVGEGLVLPLDQDQALAVDDDAADADDGARGIETLRHGTE
jgi:hypothetical protein